MQRDSLDLGKVDIPRLFRIYFVPTLMGMLSLCAVTATDGIFVGRGAGSDALAAVNICIAPTMVIMGIGLMLGVGASVVASMHLADRNVKAARLNSTQALITATFVALVFFALTLTRPEATARVLGCSYTLMPLALSYMPWIFTTCLFQLWCAIGLFIIRLDGSPRYAMWCNILPGLLNVVLDYIYIFPLGMGIEGAGIATFLSCMAGALMVIGYLVFGASTLRLIKIKASLKSLRLSLRNIGVQCNIGISALLGEATMGMMMLMGNLVFMHYIGDNGVSAFSIVCYYCPCVFMIGNAIAQSAQPIISYNYGLGDRRRVVDTERLALLSALGCGTIITLAFIIFPRGMVSLFLSHDSEATAIAVNGFPVFSAALIFFVFNLTAIGYFQSVKKVKPSIIFALLRGAVFMIPSYIVMPQLLGVKGIWLALGVSEFLTSLCIAVYYFRHREKN